MADPRVGPGPADGPLGSLADAQAALVRALVAGGPQPFGFASDDLDAAADALARKRARQVVRAWPGLATGWSGPETFEAAVARWAQARPRGPGGARDDGAAFLDTARPVLSAPAARREQAEARARYRVRPARTGEPVRVDARRFGIAVVGLRGPTVVAVVVGRWSRVVGATG